MKCQKSKIFDHVRKKKSFFQTKAQGLSLNTIIIAAIVLIVLVVLWAIFTGRMGVFSKGVTDITRETTCAEAGGVKKSGEDCGDDRPLFGKYTDVQTGDICCKIVGTCTGTYDKADGTTGECSDDFKTEATCKDPCEWETPIT